MPQPSTILIDDARSAYTHYRRQIEPGYRPGKALEHCLPALVQAAGRCGLSPTSYLHHLANHPRFGRAKVYFPSALSGAAAEQAVYEVLSSRAEIDPDELLQTQINMLERSLESSRRTAEAILFDPSIQFTSWFRVVALQDPPPEWLAFWLEKARREAGPAVLAMLRRKAPGTVHRLEPNNPSNHAA